MDKDKFDKLLEDLRNTRKNLEIAMKRLKKMDKQIEDTSVVDKYFNTPRSVDRKYVNAQDWKDMLERTKWALRGVRVGEPNNVLMLDKRKKG